MSSPAGDSAGLGFLLHPRQNGVALASGQMGTPKTGENDKTDGRNRSNDPSHAYEQVKLDERNGDEEDE